MEKTMERKGANQILKLTGTLSQVLKQFSGIYNKQLDGCDGLTVDAWMMEHGVIRDNNRGYTPNLIKGAWSADMQDEDGNLKVFTATVGKYTENRKKYDVYTKEEAEKIDGTPIVRTMLKDVNANKWNVRTLLKGLMQTVNYADHYADMSKSDKEWAKIEKVYIIKQKVENGQTIKEVVEVKKDEVKF